MPEYRLRSIEEAPATPHAGRPPLLFIHGSGHGAWVWAEHFMPYFARHGYHCVALDLRGHGESEGRADLMRFRLADYIADVARVATDLVLRDLPPPILVGHSLGGGIIERIVDQRTLNIPAAALLAPIPRGEGWRLATRAAIATFGPARMTRILLARESGLMYATPKLTRRAFFAPDTPEERVGAYWRRLQPESWMEGDVGRLAATPVLPNEEIPLLFLSGALDRVFPPAAIRLTAGLYGAEFVEVAGVAHELALDAQWERAAQALLDWLERAVVVGG